MNRVVKILRELEAHHVALNKHNGRDECESRTLKLVRYAINECLKIPRPPRKKFISATKSPKINGGRR